MPLLPVVHASPWLLIPLTVMLGFAALFFLGMVKPMWDAPAKPDSPDFQAAARLISVFMALVSLALGFAALAYGYSVLYGWGVL